MNLERLSEFGSFSKTREHEVGITFPNPFLQLLKLSRFCLPLARSKVLLKKESDVTHKGFVWTKGLSQFIEFTLEKYFIHCSSYFWVFKIVVKIGGRHVWFSSQVQPCLLYHFGLPWTYSFCYLYFNVLLSIYVNMSYFWYIRSYAKCVRQDSNYVFEIMKCFNFAVFIVPNLRVVTTMTQPC